MFAIRSIDIDRIDTSTTLTTYICASLPRCQDLQRNAELRKAQAAFPANCGKVEAKQWKGRVNNG